MIGPPENSTFPIRKISETFLDFVSPMSTAAGPKPTKAHLELSLKVGFAVWNSIVYDTVRGTTDYTDKLRQLCSANPLAEILIVRKRELFGDDLRLIGNYELRKKNGEWRLWAEARDPRTVKGSDQESWAG